MTNKTENLFEHLLSETENDAATPEVRAALHSAIVRGHGTNAQAGDATERLAAYLDGALDACAVAARRGEENTFHHAKQASGRTVQRGSRR